MERVVVESTPPGFLVRVSGTSVDALSIRRLVGQFSDDGPGDPELTDATFHITRARLKAMFLAVAPQLQRSGIPMERDPSAAELLSEIRAEINAVRLAVAGELRPVRFKLPTEFRRKLTKHQKEAVGKLLSLPHGANFSVPGAGKTTATLALHAVLRAQGHVHQLVVIAPRNAFRPWEEEIAECFEEAPRVVRLAGGSQRVAALLRASDIGEAVLLLSYQQAYFALDVIERWLVRQDRLHIVLDESHKIKNPRQGALATTVLRVSTLAARRDILTGTPAPNSLEDLGTQLSFLWPHQVVIPQAQLRDAAAEEAVTERLRPFYVRTTKRELGLRDPVIRQVPIAMGELQERIHARIAGRLARSAAARGQPASLIGQLRGTVVRLLQMATNPSLALSAAEEFRVPPLDFGGDTELDELFARYQEYEIPPKLTYAVRRVRERAASSQKTLVWSSFVRNLEMLGKLLKDFNPVVVHGGVPTALDMEEAPESSREALIDRFKNDTSCWVMIANPAACSESISLHKHCNYAVYLDRTFNAAAFLQSMDRIHRLGLPSDATVSYDLLVSPRTIDEVVDRRLQDKVRRLGRLLDDDTLRLIDLDMLDEDSPFAFDQDDAREVIAYLQEHARRDE